MAAIIAFLTAFSRSRPRSRSEWNSLREFGIAVNAAFQAALWTASSAMSALLCCQAVGSATKTRTTHTHCGTT
ncbi:hypothetical protein [Nocardia sp. XZ_19_369]|uniref:hypothetical protein n=1 Tax=Nocardia sp. XZ_19_369 TaxID=2769487 RepID=UPI00188E3D76|nr:hypothetical protein [Nocardia sp. XZ_19_369]